MKEVQKIKVEVEDEKTVALICNKCKKRVELDGKDHIELNLMHSFSREPTMAPFFYYLRYEEDE